MPESGAGVEKPELEALTKINYKPYYTPYDVWRDDPVHVQGLHTEASLEVMRLYGCLKRGEPVSNIVLEGRPGIGKTHFLGRLRAEVKDRDDIFVLFQIASVDQFWQSAVVAYMESLSHLGSNGKSQAAGIFASLCKSHGVEGPLVEKAIDGTILPGEEVRALRTLLRPIFKLDTSSLDVALALVLYSSADYRLQDIGQAFLQGIGITDEDRGQFGFLTTSGNSRVVIKGFDRLIAFSGKVSVVAVDQLDGLIAVTAHGDGAVLRDTVATGLMDFAQDCEHTLIIVSCFMSSWRNIEQAVEFGSLPFSGPFATQSDTVSSSRQGIDRCLFCKGIRTGEFSARLSYLAYPSRRIRNGTGIYPSWLVAGCGGAHPAMPGGGEGQRAAGVKRSWRSGRNTASTGSSTSANVKSRRGIRDRKTECRCEDLLGGNDR